MKRFLFGLIGLLLAGFAYAGAAQAQSISASPAFNCNTTNCTVTIYWNGALGDPNDLVYVSEDGGPLALFACSPSGQQDAPWIYPGHNYTFSLWRDNSASCADIPVAQYATVNVTLTQADQLLILQNQLK